MWDFEDAIHQKASDWIPSSWQRGIDYPGPLNMCLNILYYWAKVFGMRDQLNKLCGSCGTKLQSPAFSFLQSADFHKQIYQVDSRMPSQSTFTNFGSLECRDV